MTDEKKKSVRIRAKMGPNIRTSDPIGASSSINAEYVAFKAVGSNHKHRTPVAAAGSARNIGSLGVDIDSQNTVGEDLLKPNAKLSHPDQASELLRKVVF